MAPLPAARMNDRVTCKDEQHVGALAPFRDKQVKINGRPAIGVNDLVHCSDGQDGVVTAGSPTVLISSTPAARKNDLTNHKLQRIKNGSQDVLIGDWESELADCPMLIKGAQVDAPAAMRERIYNERRRQHPPGPLRKMREKDYAFPGGNGLEPASIYHVEVDGKTFTIIALRDGGLPGQATPEQVAQALAVLSDRQRAQTDTVVISPYESPHNDYWTKKYGSAGHRSAAESGGGTTTFYAPAGGGQGACDHYMQHEAAHNCDNEDFWQDPRNREAWGIAMGADGRSPSDYGDNSLAEDFAESVRMYNLTKGTPCEAKARERFPARYAQLERFQSYADRRGQGGPQRP